MKKRAFDNMIRERIKQEQFEVPVKTEHVLWNALYRPRRQAHSAQPRRKKHGAAVAWAGVCAALAFALVLALPNMTSHPDKTTTPLAQGTGAEDGLGHGANGSEKALTATAMPTHTFTPTAFPSATPEQAMTPEPTEVAMVLPTATATPTSTPTPTPITAETATAVNWASPTPEAMQQARSTPTPRVNVTPASTPTPQPEENAAPTNNVLRMQWDQLGEPNLFHLDQMTKEMDWISFELRIESCFNDRLLVFETMVEKDAPSVLEEESGEQLIFIGELPNNGELTSSVVMGRGKELRIVLVLPTTDSELNIRDTETVRTMENVAEIALDPETGTVTWLR